MSSVNIYSHTNRGPSRDETLLLRTCAHRCAAVLSHTLIHRFLHLFLIQVGKRYLVDPQVWSLWWPRHFLESHVWIWVFLQETCQRTTCVIYCNESNSCKYSEYATKHTWSYYTECDYCVCQNRGTWEERRCINHVFEVSYVSVQLLRKFSDAFLQLGRTLLLFFKIVNV